MSRIISVCVIGSGFAGLWLLRDSPAYVRLIYASIGLIWIIKCGAVLWQRAKFSSKSGLVFFFLAWPDVSPAGFLKRKASCPPGTGEQFLLSWISFLAGVVSLVVVSLMGRGESTLLNYIGLFSVLLIVHLGLVGVTADALRLLGFTPSTLFDRPYLSATLRDFWSNRWNRAFVHMNKIFFVRPLRRSVRTSVLVFFIFLISGLLHEIGISFADGISWGHPLSYFVIQGTGMALEGRLRFPRVLVWIWILAPLPLLFTPGFVNLFLGSLAALISDFVFSFTTEERIRYALYAGGIAHLLVLTASIQVPGKLGWREEFQKLRPLNRKVFWTYGVYIFSVILFMAIVSFVLASEPRTRAGILWIFFTAIFWWGRIASDFFYMKHSDWPQGPLFEIGHVCLTTLFLFLAALYTALGWALI